MVGHCKAITTKCAPCTANAVKDGYCIVHSKRHARAILPPILLSPPTPVSHQGDAPTFDTYRNKPLPTLPPTDKDGITSPPGDKRKKSGRKYPKNKEHVVSHRHVRNTISLDSDSSEGEEIVVRLSMGEKARLPLPQTNSTYGSDDNTRGLGLSHNHSSSDSYSSSGSDSSSNSATADSGAKWEPYYMGARRRGIPPDGVIVAGDKDGNRMRSRMRQSSRKRYTKEKHDKEQDNNGIHLDGKGDNGNDNPPPMRWPFSTPLTPTLDDNDEDDDDDDEPLNHQDDNEEWKKSKARIGSLHHRRRGIISEINLAIDSMASLDDEPNASPPPPPLPNATKPTITTSPSNAANNSPHQHNNKSTTTTNPSKDSSRFQPLRDAPPPPAGGSATAAALGIFVGTAPPPTMLSVPNGGRGRRKPAPGFPPPLSAPLPSSSSRLDTTTTVVAASAAVKGRKPSSKPLPHRKGHRQPHSAPPRWSSSRQNQRQPRSSNRPPKEKAEKLYTIWELDRICATLRKLRARHVGSENLALDAFYRAALAQVGMIADTHAEMAVERMERRRRARGRGVYWSSSDDDEGSWV